MYYLRMYQQEDRRLQCLSLRLKQKIVLMISSVHLRHVLESCGIDQAEWLAFLSSECGAASLGLNAQCLASFGTILSIVGLILRYVMNYATNITIELPRYGSIFHQP